MTVEFSRHCTNYRHNIYYDRLTGLKRLLAITGVEYHDRIGLGLEEKVVQSIANSGAPFSFCDTLVVPWVLPARVSTVSGEVKIVRCGSSLICYCDRLFGILQDWQITQTQPSFSSRSSLW